VGKFLLIVKVKNYMQKIKKWRTVLTVFLIAIFLVTTGASCAKGGTSDAKESFKPVTLKFWTVFDDRDAYADIITAYKQLHPNVTIEFKKLRFEEYEKELIEAFALGQGPDIFSIQNTWTNQYLKLLDPMPLTVSVPIKTIEGTVKKEEVIKLVTEKMYTPSQVKTIFGDNVAEDTVFQYNEGTEDEPILTPRVFGLPTSLDNMVLYYNRDILNNAGVPEPAKYWTDLEGQIEKIRKVDNDNNILQGAIALGTAKNVVRSFDILSLLMMQLKTEMVDDRGQVNFHKIPASLSGQGITTPPGINGLEFYAAFADPILNTYTWNEKMLESLQAFTSGKLAYFPGYAYHRPFIEAQAPTMNLEIAPMLQLEGYDTVNFANYWLQSVSANSQNKGFAWDFVRFMTSPEQVIKYLDKTGKPAAVRSLFDKQVQDEEMSVFVEQTLTAKSWYRGKDYKAAEKIFDDMIESVGLGEVTAKEAAGLAVQKIQQTMK